MFWVDGFWHGLLWDDGFWLDDSTSGGGGGPTVRLPGWVLASLQFPVVEIDLPQETPPP